MSNPVRKSTAGPGEVADKPGDDDIFNTQLIDVDGNPSGYVINWKTSIGAYIMADEASHVSLDALM